MTSEYRKRPFTPQPPVPEELLDPAKLKVRVKDHYKKLNELKLLKTCSSENCTKAAEETQNLYQIIIQKFQDPSEKLNLVNECFEYNFCAIICKLIEKSYEELEEFFNTRDVRNAKDLELLETLVYRCNSLICTFNEYAQLSAKFIKQAYENEILKHLFGYLKNEKIFEWIFDQAEELAQIKKPRNDLISILLDALANLVRLSSDKWEKNDAVKVLLKIPVKLTVLIKDNCELLLGIVLANLASQKEIDQFIAPNRVVKDITDLIKCIALEIRNLTNVRRIRINLDADSMDSWHEIAVVRYNQNVLLKFIELADALYHMACNDAIKRDIYEDYDMKTYLSMIIEHGNEIEQEYALKILWQLCFNSHVARNVRADKKLIDKIENLKNSATASKKKGLIQNCEGILWRIGPSKQIMISYEEQTRELCLKIKSGLETKGYKVWIDLDDVKGRVLAKMAKAVEESMCILLCVTKQYFLSPYCRSEAEYTYSRRKPFVPLMVQKNYTSESWLRTLIDQRMCVDFATADFHAAMSELEKAIQGIEESLDDSINHSLLLSPSIRFQPKRNECINWTNEEVEKWLDDKKISAAIKAAICPCNGRFLEHLNGMEEKKNELFYRTMFTASLREVISFAIELKELFP